jgi:hypothetical protein
MSATVPTITSSLIDDIEAFLVETGVAPSAFGMRAMGDPTFVFELRQGRDVLFATEAKARAQMTTYRQYGRFEDPRRRPVRRIVSAQPKRRSGEKP